MEWWSNGVMGTNFLFPRIPLLPYSVRFPRAAVLTKSRQYAFPFSNYETLIPPRPLPVCAGRFAPDQLRHDDHLVVIEELPRDRA